MKIFKFLHRWVGVVLAVFIILFAASGIVLNHRSFFAGMDINRSLLPKNYHYHNWNLAAVKSATGIGQDSLLLYGNIGIWLTDSLFTQYEPFTGGIPRGADNRRTASVVNTRNGNILAGTMSGLYKREAYRWEKIPLPVKEKRVTGIIENADGIWVLTRSSLIRLSQESKKFSAKHVPLPYPADYSNETSLFRALWVIHSGKILGIPGKIGVDILGLVMIFLSLTGIIWFVAPDVMKKLKARIRARKKMARVNRFSFQWHNKLGIWTLGFFIVITLTGMFLRPPLLIPIVNKTFPALKFTILDHPNPWHDKLRDIQYDRAEEKFILSTSEGFYYADPSFTDSLERIPHQPPISVMGINVFEQPYDGLFITGSFSGIHRWKPSALHIHDFITGRPVSPVKGMANPFGAIPVAGYINLAKKGEFLLDYNAGMVSLQRGVNTPTMPASIKEKAHIPLWNLALEIHTGRFYSFMWGDYYILFIPLAGLAILAVLISGGVLWVKQYRRKKRKTKPILQSQHLTKHDDSGTSPIEQEDEETTVF